MSDFSQAITAPTIGPGSFDINLPLLAILAASELDEISKGRAPETDHLKELSDFLRNSFQPVAPSRELLVNSSSVAVFSEALSELPSQSKPVTIDDLVARALELAYQLNPSELSANRQSLAGLKRFCIALSTSAAAFRSTILEDPESNPFEA